MTRLKILRIIQKKNNSPSHFFWIHFSLFKEEDSH